MQVDTNIKHMTSIHFVSRLFTINLKGGQIKLIFNIFVGSEHDHISDPLLSHNPHHVNNTLYLLPYCDNNTVSLSLFNFPFYKAA